MAFPPNQQRRGFLAALRTGALNVVLWIFLTPLELIFGHLSPRAIARCARVFYGVGWPFFHGMRKVARANLAVAFPDKDEKWRKATAAASVRHLVCIALEWIHLLHKPEDHLRLLTIPPEVRETINALRAKSASGHVMVLTAHIGNWEHFGYTGYLTGGDCSIVTASFTEPAINRLAERLRHDGTRTMNIPARGAAIGMLKAVKAQRDLGLLIDQNVSVRHGGVFLPFFGLSVPMSTMPASIALRSGLGVMVFGCIRQPDGTYLTEAYPLDKPAAECADEQELTCLIHRAYERLITRHPEQYLWSYRRWRTIPKDADAATAAKYPFYAEK